MNKSVQRIYRHRKLIAIVFRKNLQVKELEFFTKKKNPFQIGAHNRKKGVKLTPHIHKLKKPITIKILAEWLFVQSGKIRVTIYTSKGEIIQQKILSTGESILLMEQGHGVEFLQDSKIFEIKQGPFGNTIHSKIFLN